MRTLAVLACLLAARAHAQTQVHAPQKDRLQATHWAGQPVQGPVARFPG